MEYTRPDMTPETLLEKITLEALSALALGPSDRVADIAPLEAALPLAAKARELPEETLAEKMERLERGKNLAAENKGGALGEKLRECYDGPVITDLLWALLRTAVRLETRCERQAIYDAAALLDEGLNLQSFLLRCGERSAGIIWSKFRNIVREKHPEARADICKEASTFVRLLRAQGLARTA